MNSHGTGDAPSVADAGQRCFASRYRVTILIVAGILVLLTGLIGANVAHSLSVGGYVAPDSDSEVGRRLLTEELKGGTPNFVVLVSVNGAEPRTSAVDSDEVKAAGTRLTAELARPPGVVQAFSYWTVGQPSPLRTDDGTKALILGLISGDDDTVRRTTDRLSPIFTRETDLLRVSVVLDRPIGGGGLAGERIHGASDAQPRWGHETLVTGLTARFIDAKDAVDARLPVALAIIGLATFVLLFAMLGSVVVPFKAILLNVLSLPATFGAMVWIFQDGHLTSLLDVTPTGSIDVFTPILMFCVAFGLSMDYEVFVLSRIKQDYDITGDNTHAIAAGLDKTGRLVTAAALLLAIVFLAFMTSAVSIVKLVGLGLTLAVLVDAFLIRATLVPAIMKLAGRGNWWAPPALRRLHLRFGIWEREPSIELDRLQRRSPVRSEQRPPDG